MNDTKVELKVSPKIKNQIVVISEKNEGKSSNRTDMIEAINTMDWVSIYYLSGGVHPNNYNKDDVKEKLRSMWVLHYKMPYEISRGANPWRKTLLALESLVILLGPAKTV